jgi:hypothetical protein
LRSFAQSAEEELGGYDEEEEEREEKEEEEEEEVEKEDLERRSVGRYRNSADDKALSFSSSFACLAFSSSLSFCSFS